jgi:signal transduction histidine kinase
MYRLMESSTPLSGQAALERAVLDFVTAFAVPEVDVSEALSVLVQATAADAANLERIERADDGSLWLVSEAQSSRVGVDANWPAFALDRRLAQTAAITAGLPWIVADGYADDCPDRSTYLSLDPPIRSEACFPIVIDGTAVGMMSFLIADRAHHWTSEEQELLTTAAAIVQLGWANRSARERLDAVALDHRHSKAATQALLACSQALLMRSGTSAIEHALEALLLAIGASGAYVDPTVTPMATHYSTATRYRVVSPAATHELGLSFPTVPWSSMPVARDRLQTGAMLAFDSLEDLEPDDRASYEAAGARQAELVAPVMVHGRWTANVGLVDVAPRRWLPEDRSILEAVAAMFGAHWEREATEAELRRAIESRDAFVSSVSHELRTPLAAVVGFTNELRDSRNDFDSETMDELLGVIAAQASEVSYIVDDLLVAARSQHARLTIHFHEVDLVSEVEAAIAGMPREFANRVVINRAGPVGAWADHRRVRQIVRNLVVNASKYGGPRCSIRCGTHRDSSTIEVRDDGPEVPAPLRASMFEPYSSGAGDPGSLPSMGLGLTVSRELAQRMGGTIDYHHDGWSVFTVRLPSAAPRR